MEHRLPILALAAVTVLAACGDDSGPDFIPPPDPSPITLTPELRAISVDVEAVETLTPRIAQDAPLVRNMVYTEQIYSEFRHAQVGTSERATEPRFDVRAGDFYDNTSFDELRGEVPNHYWVVDLHRLNNEWLVDWDGLTRDEPDQAPTSLTFDIRASDFEGDYQEALVERISRAFEDADPRPSSVIIGSSLERHYELVPSDWPHLVSAVHQIRDALRAIDPAVRVSAGIDWSNFIDVVVPRFVNQAGETSVNYQVIETAWNEVLGPLYFSVNAETNEITFELDFYAFRSIPSAERYSQPSDLAEDHYVGIPGYFLNNADRTLSVAWFALGWEVNSPASDFWARFLEQFLATAGGYEMELVSWWGYGHLREAPCETMTRSVGLQRWICYRGFYTPSGSPVTGLIDAYFGDEEE